MNRLDVLRRMVRHYPGGTEVVALRLGKAASTLEKELRQAPGYKLGLLDADGISDMCIEAQSPHCHDYINLGASRAGGYVELPARDIGLQDLRASLSDLVKEASDVLSAGIEGLADDVLSDNEFRRVSRELTELLEKVQAVQGGMRAAHQASRPAHLREVAA